MVHLNSLPVEAVTSGLNHVLLPFSGLRFLPEGGAIIRKRKTVSPPTPLLCSLHGKKRKAPCDDTPTRKKRHQILVRAKKATAVGDSPPAIGNDSWKLFPHVGSLFQSLVWSCCAPGAMTWITLPQNVKLRCYCFLVSGLAGSKASGDILHYFSMHLQDIDPETFPLGTTRLPSCAVCVNA